MFCINKLYINARNIILKKARLAHHAQKYTSFNYYMPRRLTKLMFCKKKIQKKTVKELRTCLFVSLQREQLALFQKNRGLRWRGSKGRELQQRCCSPDVAAGRKRDDRKNRASVSTTRAATTRIRIRIRTRVLGGGFGKT